MDTALGDALDAFCGFNYRQATLAKFLSELKYLGVGEDLLRTQVGFWQEICRDAFPTDDKRPLLCYHVDGNTKALWSTKRVKKNTTTMLGRVMGGLEQVFVHDGHGRLDAASNRVRTVRASYRAGQISLHHESGHQSVKTAEGPQGRQAQRYQCGNATLRDCEIELKDSKEEDHLFATRAIMINGDNGKETYLATSLPKDIIGASMVVKGYFDRWPDEELPFKVMKSVASLHREAGYGKQEVPDTNVQERPEKLSLKTRKLREELAEPRAVLAKEEARIASLIPKERRLRARSRILDGKRKLPKRKTKELEILSKQIDMHEKA